MGAGHWLSNGLLWIIAAIFGLAFVAYMVLLAMNWRDEAPSPAAIQLADALQSRPAVRAEENAYVYLIGLSAGPEEDDPHTWAVKRIVDASAALEQDGDLAPLDWSSGEYALNAHRPAAVKALSESCKQADRKCLKALSNDRDVAHWLTTERWLLARYRTLLTRKGWLETLPFDFRTPIPKYSTALEAQKLLLAHAWQLAGRRDSARVKALLESDLLFWRHALASADLLISKTIAVSALTRHFGIGNLVLRRLPARDAMRAVPQGWTEPLSDSERSMLRSMAGEWMLIDKVIRQVERGNYGADVNPAGWWFIKPLLQPQATSNRHSEPILNMIETLDVDYRSFPAALREVQASEQTEADAPPLSAYNIVGSFLLKLPPPPYGKYAVRPTDLEGVRRIALLSTQLRSHGLKANQVPAALHTAELRDPYTDQPFEWDEREQSIVFTGLEAGERGRHAVVY